MSAHDDTALLETHARRIEDLIAGGVDPLDLQISSGHSVGTLPVTVFLEPDSLAGGRRLELSGSVLVTWGEEPPEIEPGVELRLVEGRHAVARYPVPEGSALFTIFADHALDVLDHIAEDHLEQRREEEAAAFASVVRTARVSGQGVG